MLEHPPARKEPPPPSVYPPREDSFLLRPFAARARAEESVLDVGTGSGLLAAAAAAAGARRVVATDRNPAALRAARERAGANGLRIELVRADLAAGLRAFDRVLFNPPYLPTAAGEEDPDPGVDLALNGGPRGTEVLERFVRELPAHLTRSGAAYVVVSSLPGPGALARIRWIWRRAGGVLRTVAGRRLEGERLWVWEFRRRAAARPTRRKTGRRRRTGAVRRPAGTTPDVAAGRTTAPGAASDRTRSPPGS